MHFEYHCKTGMWSSMGLALGNEETTQTTSAKSEIVEIVIHVW